VFTWGSNKEGQLGYGTSNSASNCIPRMVEYLKGKVLKGVSAAKYHTLVLGADSEVSDTYCYWSSDIVYTFFKL
jgi:alpha-tubulin suppressor-like RCC1 family protein